MSGTSCTVAELVDGHVALEVESLDRIYLNGYVPNLQVGGQVVSFLVGHLGNPIPSPAIFAKIGERFRAAVKVFAEDCDVPVIRFVKGDRKLDVVRPLLDRAEAAGRLGWWPSGSPRSSRACSPATSATRRPRRGCRSTRSARPTGA